MKTMEMDTRPHWRFVVPKDGLTQVLWCQWYESCSVEEAIRRLTHTRELKTWLMAGNGMSVEACVDKCMRWSKRHAITWDASVPGELSVRMRYVEFRYSWNRGEARVILDAEAARAIGWDARVQVLRGRHCPDLEKVYTLNERLALALDLPAMVEWCRREGIYERKERVLRDLIGQLRWWSSTLHRYCITDVKLCSRGMLRRRLPIDDTIAVRMWIECEQHGWFCFDSGRPEELDRMLADYYLPRLERKLDFLRRCVEYLRCDARVEREYPLDVTRGGMFLWRGSGRKVRGGGLADEHRWVYNTLCDAAEHLWYGDKYDIGYDIGLCHVQMDLPQRDDPNYRVFLSASCRYAVSEVNMKLECRPEELNERFPAFYADFRQRACDLALEAIGKMEEMVARVGGCVERLEVRG